MTNYLKTTKIIPFGSMRKMNVSYREKFWFTELSNDLIIVIITK